MKTRILNLWNQKPLALIVSLALTVRVLAAVFSAGYGMHDDHFSIIEASQSWADGTDYNDWLPKTQMIKPYSLNRASFDHFKEEGMPDNMIGALSNMSAISYETQEKFLSSAKKYIGSENLGKYQLLILKYSKPEPVPDGHSFFYVGINYIILKGLKVAGMENPHSKILIIRLLHALLSLVIIIVAYRITKKISNQKNASQVGLLLALLWFMPWLGVRNLVEGVAIPFLFIGLWMILKAPDKKQPLIYCLTAGLIMGIAFSIRFQTLIFLGGTGLALLLVKRWKEAFAFGFGAFASMIILQGVTDFFIWGKPFMELGEYFRYNMEHKLDYGSNKLEMYFEVILGLLIPPISLLWFYGFLRTWKKHVLIFLPVILFLAFHLYFPNKQERFVLTIIPFILMLGVIGFNDWREKSGYWQRHVKLVKGFMIAFWIVNSILLAGLTFTYSKRSRCEAMYFLYDKKEVRSIISENTNKSTVPPLPNFYSGRWVSIFELPKYENAPDSSLFSEYVRFNRHSLILYDYEYFKLNPEIPAPSYIYFFGKRNLEARVAKARLYFPGLQPETVIRTGMIDRLVTLLNPRNENEAIYIYKTQL